MNAFEKTALSLSLAFALTLPYSGPLALDAVALIPTKRNVDHLNEVASEVWDKKGYNYIRTTEEKASALGLFSGYDLRVGGGIITVELESKETGKTSYGKMYYDTAGHLSAYIIKDQTKQAHFKP